MSATRRAVLAAPILALAAVNTVDDPARSERHTALRLQLANMHPRGTELARIIGRAGLDPKDCAMLMLCDNAVYGAAPQAFFSLASGENIAVSLSGVRSLAGLFP